MLCRAHGATAAYTPMIHSRLFVECDRYRQEQFSTCPEDRPLFIQVCAVTGVLQPVAIAFLLARAGCVQPAAGVVCEMLLCDYRSCGIPVSGRLQRTIHTLKVCSTWHYLFCSLGFSFSPDKTHAVYTC